MGWDKTPDAFQVRATELILSATAEAQPPNSAVVTSTPNPFSLEATHVIETVTAEARGRSDVQLTCNFDGEFDFSISADKIRTDDRLIVAWEAYNTNTTSVDLEIFGGFLTDDQYQTIVTFSDESLRYDSIYQIEINGTDYQNGSYLVGIRLRDANGETLSSCSLPVTFLE